MLNVLHKKTRSVAGYGFAIGARVRGASQRDDCAAFKLSVDDEVNGKVVSV
jgi:hypothetical protein